MSNDTDEHSGGDSNESVSSQQSHGYKFLGFRLDEEFFGFELLSVREIIRLTDITPIPRAPFYIRGIINLRGKIIPVVDLRKKFGFEPKPDSNLSCIIVVDIGNTETGVIVDRVAQVLAFESKDIENSPSFSNTEDVDYILGIGKRDGKVVVLLDVAKIMATSELNDILSQVKGKAQTNELKSGNSKISAA